MGKIRLLVVEEEDSGFRSCASNGLAVTCALREQTQKKVEDNYGQSVDGGINLKTMRAILLAQVDFFRRPEAREEEAIGHQNLTTTSHLDFWLENSKFAQWSRLQNVWVFRFSPPWRMVDGKICLVAIQRVLVTSV